jgi:hypothetical protein
VAAPGLLTVRYDAGEERELHVAEMVAAPPGVALAREAECVVAGLVAASHAALHLAALTLCIYASHTSID